ncbi:MAG: 30S ribosomal protein S9 [Candidatus Woesearchaeota archaeon]|nr:30S ribosomal protein S9 [Candidatus Woesearchaeota archaeon]
MSKKPVHAAGKRKRAIARATIVPGKGNVMINNVSFDQYGNTLTRIRISEPLILAGDVAKTVDINVRVFGGGSTSQADAIRLAIARGLAMQHEKLKSTFLSYDRQLLVADVRRKEAGKPNHHGKARAAKQKSYR